MLELHPHDHSACLSIKDPNNVQAADHTKRMQWTMDACCSDPDTLAVEREIQMLADLVLQGFCYLYLSVTVGLLAFKQGMMRQPCTLNLGEGTYATFKLKQEQKKAILDTLANALDTSNTTVEYVLFGFTDTYCYDLGRNTVCSSGTLIEKGIDHWMRRVDNMDDIWHLVSKGSKLPNVLKISIFNTSTKRNGSLFIFDLLEPHFIELSSSVNTAEEASTNGIGNCFDNLRK
ncbi:hypothetical protein PS15m_011138 [Mucor circinelloides]